MAIARAVGLLAVLAIGTVLPAQEVQNPDPAKTQEPIGPPVPPPTREPGDVLAPEDVLIERILSQTQELAALDLEATNYQAEFDRLTGSIDQAREDLLTLIGVDLSAFSNSSQGPKISITDQVEELLQPLIEEFKSLTEEPREMDRLRKVVTYQTVLRDSARRALQKISAANSDTPSAVYEREIDRFQALRESAAQALSVAEAQLQNKQDQRKSLYETVSTGAGDFFRNRGLNLLLAVGAFCAVFFGMRFLSKPILKRLSSREAGRPFYFRLVSVLYSVAVILLAVLAAVVVLYVAGDWLLLGLVILVVLGVLIASKNAFPRFLGEARLVLNLGSVREGERIVYNGLPWRVDRLNLYSRLSNPLLSGGSLRIPARELFGINSRRTHNKEVWFPCSEGDWVLLADETRGKVVMQSPEMVQLVKLGGARVTYQTPLFLEQNPINLSANFRVAVTFGIDYEHQGESTEAVPALMRERLAVDLAEVVGEQNLVNLTVEFKEAGASSLDYAILADFKGEVAARYDSLNRRIQRTLVDTCNEQGWVIPFAQLTLHQAG